MAQKNPSNFSRKVDGWARAIFLTKEGKPKSATLLYSFALALFFIVLYVAAFSLLIQPIETALKDTPVWTRNAAEILIPGLVGSIPCVGFSFVSKKRPEMVVQAYAWLGAIFLIVLLIMVIFSGSLGAFGLMVFTLMAPFFAAIVIGGLASLLIYRKKMKTLAEEEKEKNRPSYYKT